MTVEFGGVKTFCARAAVIGMVAFGATACSSAPDWVDPSNWFGGGGPSDTETAAGESPDLASIPDRPTPASTSDEQAQVAESLAADRKQAKYSADALRGGTEAAAPPPPPASEAANDIAPPSSTTTASATPSAPAPSTQVASNNQPAAAPPPSAPAQDASGEITVPPATTPSATDLPPAQPSPANTLSANEPPPAAAPAYTPPPAPAPTAMATVSPSDAALGFKPSSAPPLDASVGQFVPPPLVARYNQTTGQSGTTPPRMAYATPRKSGKAMGGPEKMSGAVVANLDVLQSPAPASTYATMQGGQPTSVVLFSGDGTLLNASGRAQVRAAVEAFKAAGGQGYLRIVGHASSRTSNMPLEKHLEVIFNKSQDRANAVAKEIIKEGVPASHVLVEAVGDSQPVYYESMPQGEDGNRRAEIFLQS